MAMFDSLIERRAYLISQMEAVLRTYEAEGCPENGDAYESWKVLQAELNYIDGYLRRAHHPEVVCQQCD